MFETATLINSMVTLKFATRSSICFKVVVKSSLKLKQIGNCQACVGGQIFVTTKNVCLILTSSFFTSLFSLKTSQQVRGALLRYYE